jgi:TolB-like protein
MASTKRASQRVHVNSQFIDAISGHHIWTERYERDLKDHLALQDEIAQTLGASLKLKISNEERALDAQRY